jgi:cell division protein FtsW (lipid II flippase)
MKKYFECSLFFCVGAMLLVLAIHMAMLLAQGARLPWMVFLFVMNMAMAIYVVGCFIESVHKIFKE